MARKKQIKLDEMNVTDGKAIDGEKTGPISMSEILGTKSHRYRTTELEEYKKYINGLSRADLQNHAYDCKVLPIDSRVKLIDNLVEEFIRETSSYKASSVRRESFEHLHDDPAALQKIRNIMSRGK